MKRNLNQKLISLIEYYNLINTNIFLSNKAIKRTEQKTTNAFTGKKSEKLTKILILKSWI